MQYNTQIRRNITCTLDTAKADKLGEWGLQLPLVSR